MFLACRFVYSHTFIPGVPLIQILPVIFNRRQCHLHFQLILWWQREIFRRCTRVYPIFHGYHSTCWRTSDRENRSKKFMKSTSKSLKNRFNFLNGIRIHLHNSLFYPTIRFLFAPLSNRFRSTDTLKRFMCRDEFRDRINFSTKYCIVSLYRRIIFYHAHDSNWTKLKRRRLPRVGWTRKINESMIREQIVIRGDVSYVFS